MKLIKPSFQILDQQPGLNGVLSHIELCGRTAYKSEDKITSDSAPKFVEMLIKRGHGAVLEHGTIYLKFPWEDLHGNWLKYQENIYSKVTHKYRDCINDLILQFDAKYDVWITTNYRVLVENNWLNDLYYLSNEIQEPRITVKFVCDRGVSHEFVRHRVFSFVQESTRYCNYSNEKFGNELSFIIPNWIPDYEDNYTVLPSNSIWIDSIAVAEENYLELLQLGWLPQQARSVLPNSLKTELIMTGTIDQWKGFFKLRCAKDAHPQARELAIPLEEEFKLKQLI